MVKKKFVLKKAGAKFSERQKMYIDYHVNLKRNWKNFKDLIDIELVEIDDHSFTVLATDTDTKWHSSFARELCKKAGLDNLKVTTDNDAYLFDVVVLEEK